MKNGNIELSYNKLTGDYKIKHKGFEWVSDGRRPYIIIRKKVGKKYISTVRPLMSALTKKTKYDDNKIITEYSGYTAFGKKLPFKLICVAKITDLNSVEFSLTAQNETQMDIRAVYFPAPFNAKKKCKNSYAVDAMRNGFIMPDGYKKNLASTIAYTHYPRKINTGDCYLPIWGRVADKHGFCAIVETPYDACMFSSFGRHGAFVNSVHWCSSLGKLNYERRIKYIFHDDCDYNTIAKDYRNYLIETKQFITIDDKIKTNKNIEKLIGCPVLHHKIYASIKPESKFYNKDSENETLYSTFYKRAKQIEHIKSLGLENLYIHTDGWGEDGYDNNHPYILPPCEKAGGWDGMKTLADACRKNGYIFALHDQYRDFYYTSKAFDMEKAVTKIDGSHPYCSIWDGGEHSWLCASQALEFVKCTYTELEEHKIDVQGAYLDVFSIMWGDECFHKEHTQTRQQSIESRAECFDYLNKKGFIMSSEEPAMQLLNSIALVHHGPFALRPQENGEPVGIPAPIASLVFHDCIMLPWNCGNNWGIPKGDNGDLYCILYSGMPYFNPFGESFSSIGTDKRISDSELLPDELLIKEIDRVKEISRIQAKLYNKELISHKFLDDSYRKQQTTYSDGTVITVDFDKNTYNTVSGE